MSTSTTRERAYSKFDALLRAICSLELTSGPELETVIEHIQHAESGIFEDDWDDDATDAASAVMWGAVVAYLKALRGLPE